MFKESNTVFMVLFLCSFFARGQSDLVKNLKKGKDQVLVVYGTSLTASKGGAAWVGAVSSELNKKYGNFLTVYNSAKAGMWSTWGVKNLEDSVIKKKPNTVIIEFGMNDAYIATNTSRELVVLNLKYMVERIRLYDPNCEIILQIMNMVVGKPSKNRPHLKNYYDIYRKIAKEENLLLIDHYSNWQKLLAKGEDYFLRYVPDGIHPSPDAAISVIVPQILNSLEQGK